jgi:hypothetical protein
MRRGKPIRRIRELNPPVEIGVQAASERNLREEQCRPNLPAETLPEEKC